MMEHQLTRMRDGEVMNLDEAIFRFYEARLIDAGHVVSAVGELISLVKERKAHESAFLQFKEDDLRDPAAEEIDTQAFPESVPLNHGVLPLNYVYKPGDAEDGVTLDVDVAAALDLTPAALDWAVPGHLPAKVEHYLRGLPKDLRRVVMPLATTAKVMMPQFISRDKLTGRRETLAQAMAVLLGERFQLRIAPSVWAERPLAEHLCVRVKVTDHKGQEIVSSRNLVEVQLAVEVQQKEMSRSVAKDAPGLWKRACQKWETDPLEDWPVDEMPDEVVIGEQAGVPVKAYPIFESMSEGVVVRLVRTAEVAARRGAAGLRALLAQALRYDLAWLEKDLRAMKDVGALASTLAPIVELRADALTGITRWLTNPERVPSTGGKRTKTAFVSAAEKAKTDVRGVVPRLMDGVRETLELRQALLVHPIPYGRMKEDLKALVGVRYLCEVPFDQFSHLPRYLKGMQFRAERWRQNPSKDEEREGQIKPYVKAVAELGNGPNGGRLRWMLEEMRVSLFAQHLGTAEPVSSKKMDQAIAVARSGGAVLARQETNSNKPKPKPLVVVPLAKKSRGQPLKSFGVLGGLLRPPGGY